MLSCTGADFTLQNWSKVAVNTLQNHQTTLKPRPSSTLILALHLFPSTQYSHLTLSLSPLRPEQYIEPCEDPPRARAQAWVMVGHQMYGLPLRVQRTFYVDSQLGPEEAEAALHIEQAHVSVVKRMLPAGRQAAHVCQVRLAAPACQEHRVSLL